MRNEISLGIEKRDKLRSRIVQDPDRLKRIIKDKTAIVQDERALITNAEAKERNLQAKSESLASFEQVSGAYDFRSIAMSHRVSMSNLLLARTSVSTFSSLKQSRWNRIILRLLNRNSVI